MKNMGLTKKMKIEIKTTNTKHKWTYIEWLKKVKDVENQLRIQQKGSKGGLEMIRDFFLMFYLKHNNNCVNTHIMPGGEYFNFLSWTACGQGNTLTLREGETEERKWRKSGWDMMQSGNKLKWKKRRERESEQKKGRKKERKRKEKRRARERERERERESKKGKREEKR